MKRFIFVFAVYGLLFGAKLFSTTDATWIGVTNDWNNSSNWLGGVVPQNASDIARFSGAGTSLVNQNTTVSLGTMQFNSSTSYTIGGGIITLDDPIPLFSHINVNLGSHTINNELDLKYSTVATVTNSSDTLTFNGYIKNVVNTGYGLSKGGAGTIVINGGSDVYLNVTQGLLLVNGANTSTFTNSMNGDGTNPHSATLKCGGGNVLSNTSGCVTQITNGGHLDLNGYDQTVPRIYLGSSIDSIALNGATFTFGGISPVAGKFENTAGKIIFIGTTCTLSGEDKHTGETEILSGTMSATSTNALSPYSLYKLSGVSTILNLQADQEIGGITGVASSEVKTNSYNLTFGGNNQNTSFYGLMDGAISVGGVTKKGTGTTTFEVGSILNENAVAIQEGALGINGDGYGSFTVGSLAKLFGTGFIRGPIDVYGTIKGGASISNLRQHGALTFHANSFLDVEVNSSGQASLIDCTPLGSNTISIDPAAHVRVTLLPGSYTPSTTYTILTYDGTLTGQFSPTVLISDPLFQGTLSYPDAMIQLILTQKRVTLTGNAEKAYAAYSLLSGPDVDVVNDALNLITDPAELQAAYNQMQPSRFTALALAVEEDGILVRSSMTHRLDEIHRSCCAREALACCSNHFWAEGMGDFANQNNWNEEFGFHTSTGGVMIGLDHLFNFNGYLGLAGAYTHTSLDWKESMGNSKIDSGYLGAYGSFWCGCSYLDLALFGAVNTYDTDRHIEFSTLDRTASNRHYGGEGGAYGSLGMLWNFSGFEFRPFVSLDYVFVGEKGYTEGFADSLDMIVKKKNSDLFCTELGLYLSHCFCMQGCCCRTAIDYIIPEVGLSWVYETHFMGKEIKTAFAGTDNFFDVFGLNPSRNLFTPSASLTALLADASCSFSLCYDGEIGKDYWDHEVSVRIGKNF